MRAINIGFKFFLVAYLVRVLGNHNYGLVTWLDSVIQFFLMFINFGFNVFAAKYIVDNKSDTKKINEITSSILTIKLLFFLVSFIAVYAMSFSESFSSHKNLFLLFIVSGLGEVLFPIWYFQGIACYRHIFFSKNRS
jgi:PST family polysaccharide transporter